MKYLVIAVLLLLRTNSYAQSSTDSLQPFCMKQQQYRDFHSTVVDDDFRLYFSFPPGYDTATGKFPVLYVTDGDWNFTLIMQCFNGLKQDYITVEPIIVAIGYGDGKNQRDRDLQPANGAANFLGFLSKELIPYVQQHFKAAGERTLYGYSAGGLFASYTLFQQPELFNTVLIGAPGGAGVETLRQAENYFQSHTTLHSRVFIGVGAHELETVRNVQRIKTYLSAKKLSGLELETAVSPGMGHGAGVMPVMQQAVRFAYCKRFTPLKSYPRNIIRYAGTYADTASPDNKLRVAANANKLQILLKGVGKDTLAYDLLPTSDSSFFMQEAPAQLIIFGSSHFKVVLKNNETLVYKKL